LYNRLLTKCDQASAERRLLTWNQLIKLCNPPCDLGHIHKRERRYLQYHITAHQEDDTFGYESATDESATDEPTADVPAKYGSPTDESATDEPAANEPATDEPATDESATDEPASYK
jgi:hypothetical protein